MRIKSIFILLFLLITINGWCGFLGEYEQNQDITIWTAINNADGSAATPSTVTNARCSLWDKNDASAPTASGVLILLSDTINGFYRYKYNGGVDDPLATGECVALISARVSGQSPSAIHTLLIVDTGKSPNKRSTLAATDNIGINWGDVSNPSTTVNLSATTVNLANTTTSVTNGVTVTTNNDKTGYSLIASQLDPLMTDMEITTTMRVTRDASHNTVSTNVDTINTNTDTLEASMSTVNRKQDEAKASFETVIGYVDILPATAPVMWNDTNDVDAVYSWLTTDGNVTQDSELTDAQSALTALLEGIQQTQATMYASLNTVSSSGLTLIDNISNRVIIAGALRNTNVASAEAVYGSVIQKINSAGASIQAVWASIPNVRTEHSTIIDEVRKAR